MTQKLKTFAIILTSIIAVAATVAPAVPSMAIICGDNSSCGAGDPGSGATQAASGNSQLGNGCAGDGQNAAGQKKCLADNPIVKDLNIFVEFLSGAVGVVVVAMIIMGGIQYSMAGANPTALTAAKQRITNALIALVAFVLIFSFLQWLIPGGIFS